MTRTIVITVDAPWDDTRWRGFVTDVTEEVEQIACDTAACCPDDTYQMTVEDR